MQQTVVKPPAAAASEPEAIVSFHSNPGSRKWTWRSTNPGATTRPVASTTTAPRGGAIRSSTFATTPPSRRTSAGVEAARQVDGRPPGQDRDLIHAHTPMSR
jgi:hypothetical protein